VTPLMTTRKFTRSISVGKIAIGGDHPVVIQSMTNTSSRDVEGTLAQIEALSRAGCAIVRIAVPDDEALRAFARIRLQTKVPLVADIHFRHELAIAAIEAGADKVRINPGNIGSVGNVKKVIDAAKQARIPVRIGVNSGSLEKPLLDKYGSPCGRALFESAQGYIRMMESFGFEDVILSIKASDVPITLEACRLLSEHTDYPQHIGITESGTVRSGAVRSAVGIGSLLAQGIGDTIRVSLCGDPVEEIFVAKEILKSLGLMKGPMVIACPTCGRTQIDVATLALKVEEMVALLTIPVKIAVMGCVVNGPGEARDADIGIAGGKGEGMIFVKGRAAEKVPEERLLDVLRGYIEKLTNMS
jgi:(E)-4-hydroxy-3-methylbut-2-enyl-diphosphate synthase